MDEQLSGLAKIEAILFAHGEPLSAETIGQAVDLAPEKVTELIEILAADLKNNNDRALCVMHHADKYQLVTKPEYGGLVEAFMKKDFSQELSPAALETLTIILYRGPLSRSEIDYIRGVNSSFMVRSLLLRGLVDRIPGLKTRQIFAYQASCELLRFLGIQAVTELPAYESLHQKYETILADSQKENQIIPDIDS